ncbi:MAG: hypothetical protein SD837_14805 [Candidatus Electrothrix scaldis]|nr:MAG: hypothetical protein SD837_14805 [Candidatus Electrothrix sp. GW3-3]
MKQQQKKALLRCITALTLMIFLVNLSADQAGAQTALDNITEQQTKALEQCIRSETENFIQSRRGRNLQEELNEEGANCTQGLERAQVKIMSRVMPPVIKTCMRNTLGHEVGNENWDILLGRFSPLIIETALPAFCERLKNTVAKDPQEANKLSLRALTPAVGNCPLLTQDELAIIMEHQSARRKLTSQNNATGVSLTLSIDHHPYSFFMMMALTDRDGMPISLQAAASGFPDMKAPVRRQLHPDNLLLGEYFPTEKFTDGQFAACRNLVLALSDLLR